MYNSDYNVIPEAVHDLIKENVLYKMRCETFEEYVKLLKEEIVERENRIAELELQVKK